ncbi:palmitoyltransferase [Anaeramoeba flamelloides]|uniref:Palmitoyltransferase n=1 Tax=Anaeramoeba flamelloides TaxID=1746091 RepID=A0AAV8A715_9EUKA|nr:palmitoyltransferase [Anaeramoeba flamelloides]
MTNQEFSSGDPNYHIIYSQSKESVSMNVTTTTTTTNQKKHPIDSVDSSQFNRVKGSVEDLDGLSYFPTVEKTGKSDITEDSLSTWSKNPLTIHSPSRIYGTRKSPINRVKKTKKREIVTTFEDQYCCFKKYSEKEIDVYVFKHIPIKYKLCLPSVLTLTLILFYFIMINYLLFSQQEITRSFQIAFAIIFNYLFLLGIISFFRTLLTNPGFVPISRILQDNEIPPNLCEFPITKKQHKIWRKLPRPPRSHYSETFHAIILKPDHICFLVGNFIGLFNYKFYVLTVFYFTLETICAIIIFSNILIYEKSISLIVLIVIMLCFTVLFFIYLLKTFISHILLISKNLTWFEKKKQKQKEKNGETYNNIYNLGLLKNFKQALGNQIFLWFFPTSIGLDNDGYSFETNEN